MDENSQGSLYLLTLTTLDIPSTLHIFWIMTKEQIDCQQRKWEIFSFSALCFEMFEIHCFKSCMTLTTNLIFKYVHQKQLHRTPSCSLFKRFFISPAHTFLYNYLFSSFIACKINLYFLIGEIRRYGEKLKKDGSSNSIDGVKSGGEGGGGRCSW